MVFREKIGKLRKSGEEKRRFGVEIGVIFEVMKGWLQIRQKK